MKVTTLYGEATKTTTVEGEGFISKLNGVHYIQLQDDYVTIESLICRLGGEVIDEDTRFAFAAIQDDRWRWLREAYRQRTNRLTPRAYRVKIVVELEEMDDEDAEQIWQGHSMAHEDRYTAGEE